MGTMLFEPEAAACILFKNRPESLPFKIRGTYNPLRSLRAAARGKIAGVILDNLQHQAMKAVSAAQKVKIILRSGEIPTSPVVWFGEPNERAMGLAGVLQKMAADPDAAKLLQLLQTTGFGPVDGELSGFKLNNHEICTP
jgi:hypothetical protein